MFTLFVPRSLSTEQVRKIRSLQGKAKVFKILRAPVSQRCWSEGRSSDALCWVVRVNSLIQQWEQEQLT